MKLCELRQKVSFETKKFGPEDFHVSMNVNGKEIGGFRANRTSGENQNIANVYDKNQGQGYGKLLLLKAIYTANELNIPFEEDSREVSFAQSRVYDSLYDSLYIMQPEHEDEWFVTQEGYDYLMANTE